MFISHQCAVVAAANRNSFDCPSPMHDKMKRNGMATIQFADPNLTVYVSQADNLKAFCQCLLLHLNGMPTAVVASRHVHLPIFDCPSPMHFSNCASETDQNLHSVATGISLDDQTSAKVAAANRSSFNCPSPMHFGNCVSETDQNLHSVATGISVDDQTRNTLQNIQSTINEDVSLLAAQLQNEKATVSRAVAQNVELKSQLKELQDRLIAVINDSAAKEDERTNAMATVERLTKQLLNANNNNNEGEQEDELKTNDNDHLGTEKEPIPGQTVRQTATKTTTASTMTEATAGNSFTSTNASPCDVGLQTDGNERDTNASTVRHIAVDVSSPFVADAIPPPGEQQRQRGLLCPGSCLLRPSFADCLSAFVVVQCVNGFVGVPIVTSYSLFFVKYFENLEFGILTVHFRQKQQEHSLDQLQQSLADAQSRIVQLEQLQNIQSTINEIMRTPYVVAAAAVAAGAGFGIWWLWTRGGGGGEVPNGGGGEVPNGGGGEVPNGGGGEVPNGGGGGEVPNGGGANAWANEEEEEGGPPHPMHNPLPDQQN
ncbi:hypothetical protein niasHS_012337 [Heterodera schachtii]|uniref:Uncharacterized protein n=1 Tax=Heterodera schachtii TaxID=97005 RepID=A0ABD2IT14_HETSC